MGCDINQKHPPPKKNKNNRASSDLMDKIIQNTAIYIYIYIPFEVAAW